MICGMTWQALGVPAVGATRFGEIGGPGVEGEGLGSNMTGGESCCGDVE